MAVPFATFPLALFNAEFDSDAVALKWTLHTSSLTPNKLSMDFVNDLSNELATSGGYTGGGVAVTGTRTKTDANSWGTSRANSTAYAVGTVVRPATGNTYLYRCTVAGTSAGSIPTFGTVVGGSTTDGSVTWENVGSAVMVFTTTDPSWSTASFTGVRYAVLSNRTAVSTTAQPLVCYVDFGADKAASGGTFGITLPTQGLLHVFMP